jgi:predicted DNA-binding transcriptional regulator AlpA
MAKTRAGDIVGSGPPAWSEARYINRAELRELIPTSDMTVYRWQRDPRVAFPAPVKLGADGRNFWWLPAILEWQQRRAERVPQRPAGGRHGSDIAGGEQPVAATSAGE